MLLIPPDSPMRNPPAALNDQQKVTWDGLRFAFDMMHISYTRLVATLERISKHHGSKDKAAEFTEDPTLALTDAWAVVDNLWRLHQVLRNARGLKGSPDLEVVLRAIAKVKGLRDGIQHAGENLKTIAAGRNPLLGSLSWIWTGDEPEKRLYSFAIGAGSVRDGWMPLVNPAGGRSIHRPIGLVTLSAFGEEIELTDLVVRGIQLARGLDASMREQAGTMPTGGADIVVAVVMEPARPPDPEPAAT
jgi:hypothetical protein